MACRFAGFGSCCADVAVGIGNQFTRKTAELLLLHCGVAGRGHGRTGGVYLTPLMTLGQGPWYYNKAQNHSSNSQWGSGLGSVKLYSDFKKFTVSKLTSLRQTIHSKHLVTDGRSRRLTKRHNDITRHVFSFFSGGKVPRFMNNLQYGNSSLNDAYNRNNNNTQPTRQLSKTAFKAFFI